MKRGNDNFGENSDEIGIKYGIHQNPVYTRRIYQSFSPMKPSNPKRKCLKDM
jgi:hypothetical protein